MTVEITMGGVVAAPYDEVVERVRLALGEAGFGVLSEIDIASTLRAKLGVEGPPKVILGACRPELAHRALQVDARIAALLPCNVVVTGLDAATTRVEAMDPRVMSLLVEHPEVQAVAAQAWERLAGMIAGLTASGATTTEE